MAHGEQPLGLAKNGDSESSCLLTSATAVCRIGMGMVMGTRLQALPGIPSGMATAGELKTGD